MYNTRTSTYTVVDIRRSFESCEADVRTIARRTGKWSQDKVDDVMHDVIKLAENKYLASVDIVLIRKSDDQPIRATRFTVNENGRAMESDRAGRNNDWPNEKDTYLSVILTYNSGWSGLTKQQKKDFREQNDFRVRWGSNDIDTEFPHLTGSTAQLYASKGYELQKTNFR